MKRITHEAACIDKVFDDPIVAERYEKHIERYTGMLRNRYLRILSERGISSGKFLDAGCGAGQVAVGLAKTLTDISVTGVDLGEAILTLARNRAQREGLSDRITTRMANVEALPYPDDSFDVVMNASMLHMVEDPVRMLNQIERVLKPGGLLLISNIKRVWFMALFSSAFRTTYTWPESKEIIERSNLRPWSARNGLIDFTLISDSE